MKHTFRHEQIKEDGRTYDMIFANEHPYVVGQVQDIGAEIWDKAMPMLEESGKTIAKASGRKDFVIIGAGVHQRVEIRGEAQWQEMKDTLQEMADWWAANHDVKSIWDMDVENPEGKKLNKQKKAMSVEETESMFRHDVNDFGDGRKYDMIYSNGYPYISAQIQETDEAQFNMARSMFKANGVKTYKNRKRKDFFLIDTGTYKEVDANDRQIQKDIKKA